MPDDAPQKLETFQADPNKVSRTEKLAVIVILGGMAFYSFYLGKFDLGTGFISTLTMYFLARSGV